MASRGCLRGGLRGGLRGRFKDTLGVPKGWLQGDA